MQITVFIYICINNTIYIFISPEFLHEQLTQITIFRSIVVSILACHAGDPGSIPGGGAFFCTFAAW